MKQIPVIFWTGTGNTQMMADAIAEAINAAGAEAVVKNVSEITADEAAGYDALALGCPAMGAEVLGGKKVALFGSYGWGGSYMQDWEARVKDAGATLVADGVLALGAPDDEAMAKLAEAGKLLAE